MRTLIVLCALLFVGCAVQPQSASNDYFLVADEAYLIDEDGVFMSIDRYNHLLECEKHCPVK